MKKKDFIGVWKLIEYGEGKILTSETHLVVKAAVLWEVWPDTVYYENESGPEVKYTFEEGKPGEPAKLSLASGFKYLVKKSGDTLWVKLGPVYGQFPKSFEDSGNLGEYQLETAEISKTVGVLPEKVKVQEFEMRGFGTLKYDSNLEWWDCQTKFNGKKIKLQIAASEADKFGPLETIKEKLKQLEGLPLDQIATDKLLSLFNESWNENDVNLTPEEFIEKITLESITLKIDGGAAIWFKDGDLFAGHSINISLDKEYNVSDVGIMG